jgi:hypothetical protein
MIDFGVLSSVCVPVALATCAMLTTSVGCNSENDVLKSQVVRSISALRKDREDEEFLSSDLGYALRPWIIQLSANKTPCSYLRAKSWEELEAVAYRSLNNCAVDRMVRLIHGQPCSSTLDGLTVMQFSNKLSLFLPYILSPLVVAIRGPKRRATAISFVIRASALSSTVIGAPIPAENGQVPRSMEEANPKTSISVEGLEAPATPGEANAAIVIQVAYKRALRRRTTPSPKDGKVKLWYDQCVDAQTRLQGPKTYSKYFLGPLVHVLIWADSLVRLLKRRKMRLKKKFKNTDHIRIEDLEEHLTTCK